MGQAHLAVRAPLLTGVLAVTSAVVLSVFLSGGRLLFAGQGPYRVTATMPAGKSAGWVAVDPGTHTVYVTNSKENDNSVSVIDASTHTVTAAVSVGKDPIGVAVDPDTHTVYVANSKQSDSPVSVIDASTRTVTGTVPVGKDPASVAVDPGTHTVYVTNYGGDTVSVIEHR